MLGDLLDNRYRIIRTLSKGGFGQTYIVEDTRRPGDPHCVMKHLKPMVLDPLHLENARRLFQAEAIALERLGHHSQIPRLLAYFEENNDFYLVQDLIRGYPLTKELKPGFKWLEADIYQLLFDVLSILIFVHERGVIHRDIKPDNLIRQQSDRTLVLVDFGSVKQIRLQSPLNDETGHTIAIGTMGYMSTEQARGRPRPNSDLYSLGIIGIQAATGIKPKHFREDNETGELIWRNQASISDGLADFLEKMVAYHFKDRYVDAREALRALKKVSPDNHAARKPLPEIEKAATEKSSIYWSRSFLSRLSPGRNPFKGEGGQPPPPQPTFIELPEPTEALSIDVDSIMPTPSSLSSQRASDTTTADLGNPDTMASERTTTQANLKESELVSDHSLPSHQELPPSVVDAPSSSSPSLTPEATDERAAVVLYRTSSPESRDEPSAALKIESPVLATWLTTFSLHRPSAWLQHARIEVTRAFQTLQHIHAESWSELNEHWQRSRSHLPGKKVLFVTGISSLIAAGIGVQGYQQFRQWNAMWSALREINDLRQNERYEECKNRADSLQHSYRGDHQERVQRSVINLQGDCTLLQAKQFANEGEFQEAIAEAQTVPLDSKFHNTAQAQIKEWGTNLLGIAREQYDQGNLNRAIELAGALPREHPLQTESVSTVREWEAEQDLWLNAQELLDAGQWQEAIAQVQPLIDSPPFKHKAQGLITTAEVNLEIAEEEPDDPEVPLKNPSIAPSQEQNSEQQSGSDDPDTPKKQLKQP